MKLIPLAAALAVLTLAASCSSGTEGIFASIEREQKIVSLGGLSETATVTSMAELTGTVNKYFATGGKALFSRSTDPAVKTWQKGTVGGAAEVAAVGTAGSKVFAVAGGGLWASDDGDTWTAVALASGDTAYDLVPVRKGDGISSQALIVVAATSDGKNDSYQHVYRVGPAGTLSAQVVLSTSALAAPVRSAIDDGTNEYLLSETSLWQLNSSLVATPVTVTGVSGHDMAGLIYLDGSASVGGHSGYYLSTLSNSSVGGGLYRATVPGTFTALQTNVKVLTKPVGFGGWLYCVTNDSLWVATGATTDTEGTGYMEFFPADDSFTTTPRTDSNNYASGSLPTSAVGTLFHASSGAPFLGTVAHGLWTWNTTTKIWSRQ